MMFRSRTDHMEMRLLVLVVVSLLGGYAECAAVPALRSPSHRSPRIAGGHDAEIGEFPFQVSIQHTGVLGHNHLCGGVIVSDDHVLTAAHCLDGFSVHNIQIYAGITRLSSTAENRQVIAAAYFIVHEEYSDITLANDIALIKLKHKFHTNEFVNVVPLPYEGEVVQEGETCTIVGWGAVFENWDLSDTLQKGTIPLLSDNYCRSVYGYSAIEDTILCASTEEGVDACAGDRGGPLLCHGRLHGISSWGQECAHPFYPGVYTEVSAYRQWILEYTVSF